MARHHTRVVALMTRCSVMYKTMPRKLDALIVSESRVTMPHLAESLGLFEPYLLITKTVRIHVDFRVNTVY